MTELDETCISCEEDPDNEETDPYYKCPKSQRPCGHHCNHSWSHEKCDWCGAEFGEIEESPSVEYEREIKH
jgi:hypothetical protein